MRRCRHTAGSPRRPWSARRDRAATPPCISATARSARAAVGTAAGDRQRLGERCIGARPVAQGRACALAGSSLSAADASKWCRGPASAAVSTRVSIRTLARARRDVPSTPTRGGARALASAWHANASPMYRTVKGGAQVGEAAVVVEPRRDVHFEHRRHATGRIAGGDRPEADLVGPRAHVARDAELARYSRPVPATTALDRVGAAAAPRRKHAG